MSDKISQTIKVIDIVKPHQWEHGKKNTLQLYTDHEGCGSLKLNKGHENFIV